MTLNTIPKPEHPRPDKFRPDWLNLNGEWDFEFDFTVCGMEKELFKKPFENGAKIIVPFPPESSLSGVHYTDFIPAMFYRRKILVPANWQNKRVILHFGAVDCECRVFIDGEEVGSHAGGQTSFEFDITSKVKLGETQTLTIYVHDDVRSKLYGGGKQSWNYKAEGCLYTRATGIWQTVWLEAVDFAAIKDFRIGIDFMNGGFSITPKFYQIKPSYKLQVTAYANEKEVGKVLGNAVDGQMLYLPLQVRREWNPDDPFLYSLNLQVFDDNGKEIDSLQSYAGLREISVSGNKLYLNGEEIFLRFSLDQGYYPDGVWTAPSDEALKHDIELGLEAGFNGARLHQKVFEPRYHYWADKLGYLTWAEFGSWGLNWHDETARNNFFPQWREAMERDINHPSIIGWVPLNESSHSHEFANTNDYPQYKAWVEEIYNLTKSIDFSRPVNTTSGYLHIKTDLWTVHSYAPDADALAKEMFPENSEVYSRYSEHEVKYSGQPYLNDEFGGFLFETPSMEKIGHGYFGIRITDDEEFYKHAAPQVDWMINNDKISGYCYTQLYDVEMERNGVYQYDRTPKIASETLKKVFGKKNKSSKW